VKRRPLRRHSTARVTARLLRELPAALSLAIDTLRSAGDKVIRQDPSWSDLPSILTAEEQKAFWALIRLGARHDA
jgi:hypothetical protein